MRNYVVYHLHSDLSNATTTMDSVTKYKMYIDKAKECGMTAMAFSEHGNIFEWYHKKCDIESAGMKYIHACEVYITETLEDKIRDNYHCVLIAKNFEGFKELNSLTSKAFNRNDNHFYFVPRITLDELFNTSDNIIVTTACLGGILNVKSKKDPNGIYIKYLKWLISHKDRCYLEIQHHNVDEQKRYNQELYKLNQKFAIPLIAGTDTHSLDERYAKGRVVLQKAKHIYFSNEDGWDLTFKTYDELVKAYEIQNSLPKDVYLQAIENTNVMADRIETFELDTNTKYPKLYDNPEKVFKDKIIESYKNHKYRGRYDDKEMIKRLREEFEVYKKTKSIDFMLLQKYQRDWEKENDIQCGYSRGSVSGSQVAYYLGITEMDSTKFNLNFFRFMNPSRVTNADIDSDYGNEDRAKVKYFLLHDHMNLPNLQSSEIITFNTIKDKGAVRDVCRALNISLDEADYICNTIEQDGRPSDSGIVQMRKQYPEVFEYVDLLNGVIVSIGSHPSGVLVTTNEIDEMVGSCTLSTSDYPVSCLNMKELDALMYVKLDILGLDNITVVNEVCKMLGIERKTPDNTDLDDMNVWKSIRDDTTGIFQWESEMASTYLKKFMSDETLNKVKSKIKNFSMIKWFSFGNGLIRPACASYRYDVADGIFYDNGLKELDEFLSPTLGHLTMQEDIMQFLVKFCGYSMAESDNVRRGIAKKKGTEQLIPEIKRRFIEYTSANYNVPKEKCAEIIEPFVQVILDASAYAFSWNHSDSYSCLGYILGWLRYYYPLEFFTVNLNINIDNMNKTNRLINVLPNYNIKLSNIKFGKSIDKYTCDKNTNTIYKGISSIKYLNSQVAKELYELSKNKYTNFVDLLKDINEKTSCNSRQLEILITLNFFSDFGCNGKLLKINELYNNFMTRKQIKISDIDKLGINESLLQKYAQTQTPKLYKDLDMAGYINEVIPTIENKSLSIKNQIKCEAEYLGSPISIWEKAGDSFYVVTEYKCYSDKSKPYITLYQANSGKIIKTKVKDSQFFILTPFALYSLIKVVRFTAQKKTKNINGKWVKTDEDELILSEWQTY